MRTFEIHRPNDKTGMSGTGKIIEGIEFWDGTVAYRWVSEWPTTVVANSIHDVMVVVTHRFTNGTYIQWMYPGSNMDVA